jgi:3-hydroxyacyl-[acyl-carrier-protein] dehydratase
MTPGEAPPPRIDPKALGLPHREPFVFIDSIRELAAGERAVGEKTFPRADPIFRGHFPGDPLVPGVLLVEALAQVAGCAAGQPGRPMRLAAIKGVKFPNSARPDELISLAAQKVGAAGGLWQFAVEARVAERIVAEGVLVLAG